MRMRIFVVSGLVAAVAVLAVAPASAEAGKGTLFHDGDTVRTVVVPAPLPRGGTDPFFTVTNGAEGQLGIAGLAPGDPGYSGGDWAFHEVTFVESVTPYLLMSAEDVATAEAAGDVTVTRLPEDDFRCPVQP